MKAGGNPISIGSSGRMRLEQVRLGAGTFDEDWLQSLIFDHPEVLPIARIEPAFHEPMPIAREVRCGHGYIDNVYLTPAGEIILIEAKLWRNSQARREVVAQALDYVSALMSMRYEEFETAVLGSRGDNSANLYALISDHPEALDEADFIDAVACNLARGRMLVIALGDGIRQETETLASLLQSHAGAHFTFALVELGLWKNPETGEILAIPNTLAQTVMIERGILLFESATPRIEAVPGDRQPASQTISDRMFFEELAKNNSKLPGLIQNFLRQIEPLGVYPDLKASLNLKVDVADAEKPINLGYIRRNGKLRTSPLSWTVPEAIATRYNQALADLISGIVATHDGIFVTTNGRSEPPVSMLLPAHAEGWVTAIRALLEDLHTAEERPLGTTIP